MSRITTVKNKGSSNIQNAEYDNFEPIIMHDRTKEKLVDIVLSNITWERTLCTFHVSIESKAENVDYDLDYYLVTGYYMANAKLICEKKDDRQFDLSVMVTNPGYVRCLPTAHYSLYACYRDDIICRVRTDVCFAKNISITSRIFLHGAQKGYLVYFSIAEENGGLYPQMRVMDTEKRGLYVFTDRLDKNAKKEPFDRLKSKLKKRLKNSILRWMQDAYNVWDALYHRFRRQKKTVLFMSEKNESLTANLKAVYDRMIERGLDKEYNMTVSLRSIVDKKKSYGILSWYLTVRKLAKSDVIFVDDHCPLLDRLKLSGKASLIQLWHAGAGYKGVGYCRWGHRFSPPAFSCHRQYRYCISPSKGFAHYFAEQFGINLEQIIATGMPRMDKYLNKKYREDKTKELYKRYPLCRNKRVILFAPTYRGKDKDKAYYPYEMIDFDSLYETCGSEWIVLFKMHPWVKEPVPIKKEHEDRFIDVNNYGEINDLFYITDLYVSDYSSGIFEYSLMQKPALFYAFDELQYSYSRGFHRDYRSSTPGKICNTFDELLLAIKNRNYEYEKMKSYIKEHFDHIDSRSSDRVIDWFLLDKLPEEYKLKAEQRKKELNRLLRLDFIELDTTEKRGGLLGT